MSFQTRFPLIGRRLSFLALILLFAASGCENDTASTGHAVPKGEEAPAVTKAVVVLQPVDDSGVGGLVFFEPVKSGIKVTGEIHGLQPGKHGFHVHEFGDITGRDDGKTAGGHFAPRGNPHGKPADEQRHVGDLGNIVANDSGDARIDMTDSTIALRGPYSILGRALVVHAGEDKFTQPSGDAGARVAFGVIGVASTD